MKSRQAGTRPIKTLPSNRSLQLCLVFLSACWMSLMSCGEAFPQKRPVYVTASFLDKNDLFIENLSRDEIEILENGEPRKIEFMAMDELPTVYGILFERDMLPESINEERFSDFTIPTAAAARSIAYELIDKYLGRQAMWVAAYEREFELASDTTVDAFTAKSAIQQLHGNRTRSDSFLYAALMSAVQKMNERPEKRRVLILFLQDLDSDTAGKAKALKNLFSAANVELFVVGFTTRLGSRVGASQASVTMSAMQEIAHTTAGQAFFTITYGQYYDDIVRRMHSQIRTLYTFGVEATSTPDHPGTLEIKCSRPGSKVAHHLWIPALK